MADLLTQLYENEDLLLQGVLMNIVKPIFQGISHFNVDEKTGRGAAPMTKEMMAVKDCSSAESWKSHVGIWNVISWCIRNTSVGVYFYKSIFIFSLANRLFRVVYIHIFGISLYRQS